MTQKERLVELLNKSPIDKCLDVSWNEYFSALADHLLSNGVIILPVAFGNFYIPFEKDFDYGTLRAFADNRQAQDYLIAEEKT